MGVHSNIKPYFLIGILAYLGLYIYVTQLEPVAAQKQIDQGQTPQADEVIEYLNEDWIHSKYGLRTYQSATLNEKLATISQWVQLAKKNQDNRYMAFAHKEIQNLLSNELTVPWKTKVLYQLADIQQYQHHFTDAIRSLNQILSLDAQHLNARLMRSNLYTITGNYKNALRDCATLFGKIDSLITLSCITQNRSRMGNLQTAYKQLKSALGDSRSYASPWSYSIASDLARRLNLWQESKNWLYQGHSQFPKNAQLIYAEFDLLIHRENCADLKQFARLNPDQIYQKIIMAKCGNQSTQQEAVQSLQQFIEREATSSNPDHRLLANIYYFALNSSAKAIEHAQENWRSQKEPEDFRLAYRLALQEKNRSFLRELLNWQEQNQYEDFSLPEGMDS